MLSKNLNNYFNDFAGILAFSSTVFSSDCSYSLLKLLTILSFNSLISSFCLLFWIDSDCSSAMSIGLKASYIDYLFGLELIEDYTDLAVYYKIEE